jgi:hypothetical protein
LTGKNSTIFSTNEKKRGQISGTVVNQASPYADASKRMGSGMNVRTMKGKAINERGKIEINHKTAAKQRYKDGRDSCLYEL